MFARGMPRVFLAQDFIMAEKYFNPDVDYHGAVSKIYRQKHEKINDGIVEFNVDTHCPYDKTICKQKLLRLDMWKEGVVALSAGKVNRTIVTRADMFRNCPVPHLDCIRRLRYENIINAMAENEKQR